MQNKRPSGSVPEFRLRYVESTSIQLITVLPLRFCSSEVDCGTEVRQQTKINPLDLTCAHCSKRFTMKTNTGEQSRGLKGETS
ncbi:hypothetical protein T12_12183 [Trichinella patagoniensis]|uniref:Uncharacterized protein n=1 Tax=Trichinella patagoniensis TaxID=990121 RepID=A0A0V0ZEU1_9BILA|nr:hypothetical protein T12_12358 [Trichinella patagoniensis]KRY07572.1 hypothetical protein T12_6337 [Trichinella patagoniensis]KRY10554.1 hypothetical protein T12_12183 [Trichinella patagoniensis]